jgi:hypothetical protein
MSTSSKQNMAPCAQTKAHMMEPCEKQDGQKKMSGKQASPAHKKWRNTGWRRQQSEQGSFSQSNISSFQDPVTLVNGWSRLIVRS